LSFIFGCLWLLFGVALCVVRAAENNCLKVAENVDEPVKDSESEPKRSGYGSEYQKQYPWRECKAPQSCGEAHSWR